MPSLAWQNETEDSEIHGRGFPPHAQREQLKALSAAIGELTERQREVFVAIALNDVPIDVHAMQLGANRNAIYKNLFDARRNLRARMAAVGHPVPENHPVPEKHAA